MIEPLEMYAHVPVLFKGYAKLEQATARLHRLDNRLHALAELKAATLTYCEYCTDMGSAISRRWGLTDEEILTLPSHRLVAARRSGCSAAADITLLIHGDLAVGLHPAVYAPSCAFGAL